MNHALVVGAEGTIGSALFSQLQKNGVNVWGTTHKTTAQTIFHLNLLDDPAHWQFPKVTFDVAYLSAGICRMALCEEDPTTTRQVNIAGMEQLIRRLAEAGTFIIYLSTNQVFSGKNPFESAMAAYQPLNEYGRQKAEMEEIIKSHCKRFAIVRLTKVVERNMSLVKNWIDQLLQDQPIQAFHDMWLAPVSLAQVVTTLIPIGQKKKSGYYQLSGSEDISYTHLAHFIAQCLKKPPSLVQSISAIDKGIKKIFLPQFTTLDCSSTIALCSFKPPHFSDVLNECFDITE